jgi:glycosyltransferase involved in cell wall biosynthesis
MKKILFITPFEPSKKTGGQNFTRMLLKDLAHDFEIDLIMFINKKSDFEIPEFNVNILKIFYLSKLIKMINVFFLPICFPFFSCRFNLIYLLYIRIVVKKNKYDIIYIDYSQLFIYGLFLKKQTKILMSHDVIYQRYLRKEKKFILKYCMLSESYILKNQQKSTIFTFSNKDSKLLEEVYIVNSITTKFFLDIPRNISIQNIYNRIVFFGSWKRPDNLEGLLWFINNIYMNIDNDIEVIIIGSSLEKVVIKRISAMKNCKYLGFIPNPYQVIAESKLLVAPIFHGAGVKVKVIESLAVGTAVIGTEIAFEGISSEYSNFMLYAENNDEFINIINNYSVTKDEKKIFREYFCKTYEEFTISKYIRTL